MRQKEVFYEQTTDANGQTDWFIYYLPGPNAAREYQEFTGNIRRKNTSRSKHAQAAAGRGESLLLPFAEFGAKIEEPRLSVPVTQAPRLLANVETTQLIEELIAAELNRSDAERFAREKPEEARRQIQYLPFKTNVESPGAYLRAAIEGGYAAPKEYLQTKRKEEQEQKKREESARRQAAEALKLAQEAAEAVKVDESLAQLEKTQPEAFTAFLAYVEKCRADDEARYHSMPATVRSKMRARLDTLEKRRELFQQWNKEIKISNTV